MKCFQWSDDKYDLQHIKEELVDMMVYSQKLLDKLGLSGGFGRVDFDDLADLQALDFLLVFQIVYFPSGDGIHELGVAAIAHQIADGKVFGDGFH